MKRAIVNLVLLLLICCLFFIVPYGDVFGNQHIDASSEATHSLATFLVVFINW